MIKRRLAKIDLLIDMGRYEEGLEESELLIAEMPESHIGYVYAALCEYNLDKITQAEILLKQSLSIEPEMLFSLGLLARIEMAKLDHRAAWTIASEILRIDPEYIDGYVVRGEALLNLQNYEQAKLSIEKGLSLEPDNVGLLSLKASCGFATNDMNYAKAGIDLALNKDPENPELLLLHACRKMELNDFEGAEAVLHSAIIRDPNNESIRMALVECKKGKSKLFGVFYKYGFRRWTYEFTLVTVICIIIAIKGFILVTLFFSIFMLLMWYGDVMYNSFLRLGKRSRYLLSQKKIVQSNLFLICNIIMLVLVFSAYFTEIPLLWKLLVMSITTNLIGISFFEMGTKSGKISAAIVAFFLLLSQFLIIQLDIEVFIAISLILIVLYGLLFSFRVIGR